MSTLSVLKTPGKMTGKAVPFPVFDEAELQELRQLLPATEWYHSGQNICQYGESGDTLFIVLDGRVRMFYTPPGVENKDFHTVEKGGFFGEVAALLSGPRTATAQAADLTQLLVLKANNLDDFLTAHPRLARRIMEGMAWRLRNSGVLMHETPVRDLSLHAAPTYSQDDQAVLGVAKFLGQGRFLLLFGLLFAAYIGLNWGKSFDPGYIAIALSLSVLQIVIGNVILNSQNRAAEKEQPLTQKEREANLHAAQDIVGLQNEMRVQYAEMLRRVEALTPPTPPSP